MPSPQSPLRPKTLHMMLPIPDRALQENRPLPAATSRANTQLLPRSEADFQRGCRRSEQQGQSHYEKILWVSHLQSSRTRALSLTWQASRTGTNPRVFLRSPFFRCTVMHKATETQMPNCSNQLSKAHRAERIADVKRSENGDDVGMRVWL